MSKVRIGLIGCGGRSRSHQNSFLQMPDEVEIVAVADPIEERRVETAKKFGCTRLYKDHNEFYANESKDTVDALVIAIEPTAHVGVEEGAIEKGFHFIIEKPMTLDLDQADKLNAMIKEKGIITSVGFQDRYLDLMEIVKEELPKHKAGGLVYGAWVGGIPGVWWWKKKSTCGGQLVEQNIHLADGLRWLYGEPISVYATSSKGMLKEGVDAPEGYDTDDHSTAVFTFENHVTATLVSGCYSKGIRPRCGLYIALNDMILDYRLRNNLIISTPEGVKDIPRSVDQTLILDQVFVEAVRTGDASKIRSDYDDALKSLKMCFAAEQSMATGQVVYFK